MLAVVHVLEFEFAGRILLKNIRARFVNELASLALAARLYNWEILLAWSLNAVDNVLDVFGLVTVAV